MHFSEARQGDFPMNVDVLIRALVHVLHQVLLKQEWVVSSHGAGVVMELLVIVANVRLPLGREKFVHIHLVTQRHHEHNACQGTEHTPPCHTRDRIKHSRGTGTQQEAGSSKGKGFLY